MQIFPQLWAKPGFKLKAMENQSPERNEFLWRRQLSEAERAELRAQPELELEARLTEALTQISNAPVPSNFTARVLDALNLEDARAGRPRGWHWSWRLLLPRLAVTAAIILFAGVGVQRYQAGRHRADMVKSLSVVASAQAAPSVDALNNFDAIQRMSQSGRADNELLAALQ
jgi:hypothetical protein